jgi:biopolymer transport protein ExbD
MATKHAHTGGPVGGVNLNIIITPMLDMAFQLLAFFIMTYHPSALEGHIDGTLLPPSKSQSKGPADKKSKDDSPPLEELDPKLTETLLVKIEAIPKGQEEGGRREGEPRAIKLFRADSADRPILISGNREAADLEKFIDSLAKELDGELKKILKEAGSSNNDLKLEADANLKHKYWMKFYDVCKGKKLPDKTWTGFTNIHFVSPVIDRKN